MAMIEYVCGFLFSKNGQVALIRKARPEWQCGLLNGVGGRVEDDETIHGAMAREFLEETGHETRPAEWSHRVTLAGSLTGGGWRVYFFRARLDHSVSLVVGADEPVGWYDIGCLPQDVIPNLRWLIPLCLDDDLKVPVLVTDLSDPETTGAAARQKSAGGL